MLIYFLLHKCFVAEFILKDRLSVTQGNLDFIDFY